MKRLDKPLTASANAGAKTALASAASTALLVPFDAYEVHGMKRLPSSGQEEEPIGRVIENCEMVPDDQAEFWSLFGHIPGQGIDCIGDFDSRQRAEEILARIAGRRDAQEARIVGDHSPGPWSYDYSPYTVTSDASPLGVGAEIPAYEVIDADGNKVFDTNEDSPAELQEANACLGSTAPRLLASLVTCANLLADHDESDGPEGDAYREALATIREAAGRAA